MSSLKFQAPRTQTFIADADFSANKYFAVKLTTEGNVALAGAGEGIGILMNNPALGGYAEVAMNGGGAAGQAGATIAVGDELASNAAGKLIPALTTNIVLGIALQVSALDEYVGMERVHYVKD